MCLIYTRHCFCGLQDRQNGVGCGSWGDGVRDGVEDEQRLRVVRRGVDFLAGGQDPAPLPEVVIRVRVCARRVIAGQRVTAGAGRAAGWIPPSPVTRFFEGGRVSQTLDGVSKTLFDST